jgi:ferritin-like metal-binding protein YciE
LVTYAKLMKHPEAKRLLEITLEEEKAANSFLTEIANTEANLS